MKLALLPPSLAMDQMYEFHLRSEAKLIDNTTVHNDWRKQWLLYDDDETLLTLVLVQLNVTSSPH